MEDNLQHDPQELIVRTSFDEHSVVVRFIDTGPGIGHPELLFLPFQPGAQASGLGLYLSRTFVRAFERGTPPPSGLRSVIVFHPAWGAA